MKKIMQFCYINVILVASILLAGGSLEKCVDRGAVETFFKSTLPIIVVDELEEKLKTSQYTSVIKGGGVEKINEYLEQEEKKHHMIVDSIKSLTPLPLVVIDLVKQYCNDSVSKGVLVRDHWLVNVDNHKEFHSVYTGFPTLPNTKTSLVLHALYRLKNFDPEDEGIPLNEPEQS